MVLMTSSTLKYALVPAHMHLCSPPPPSLPLSLTPVRTHIHRGKLLALTWNPQNQQLLRLVGIYGLEMLQDAYMLEKVGTGT